MTRRVIKFGGSLFQYGDVSSRIAEWLDRQLPAVNVWIAGGGEMVDIVRRWDARFGLGEPVALAITLAALQSTRELLRELLTGAGIELTDVTAAQLLTGERRGITQQVHTVASLAEMTQEFPDGWHEEFELASWNATSDTFAALVARTLNADELVLLKSCAVPRDVGANLVKLAELNIVDAVMPRAARGIPAVRVESLMAETKLGNGSPEGRRA